MQDCRVVTITTPKKYLLNGLLFGGAKAKTGFIFIHGLTDDAFGKHKLFTPLVNEQTSALFFNNRGHDVVAWVKRINNRTKKGYTSEEIGTAHEVFTDCADDIQGAVDLLISQSVENIYLVGHSTGTQKAVYYLSRAGKQQLVKGVVLLCPISDVAYSLKYEPPVKLKKAIHWAKRSVQAGKPRALLPPEIWPDELLDAQRFLSINTPDSIEQQIFSYFNVAKKPKIFQKVQIPMLVVLAEEDEYSDRSARQIAHWFEANNKSSKFQAGIIKDSLHNLRGHETEIASAIKNWT